MSNPTPDLKSSKKSLIAIGILAYVAAFFLYSAAWNVQPLSWAFLAPLSFSLVAVIVYSALGAILPPKWHLSVFSVGALVICLWSWNTPKTWQECVLAETKTAKTDAAANQIIRICREKFR
jgi:hypothetical protein